MGSRDGLPGAGEVHVWSVELAGGEAAVERCARSLSDEEKERAARFYFPHLRTSFTLARGILRALLGRYLGMGPGRVGFAYGPKGKPRIAFPETPLRFNLSHSGAMATYAFAVGCEVGVDIEQVREQPGEEGIVRRFFSPAECQDWLALDASLRNEAFFRCWTRKEAYIKAVGDGFSMPLDSFRVSLRPEAPPSLMDAAGGSSEARRWVLYSWTPAKGYLGALALREHGRSIRALPRLSADAVLELVNAGGPFPPSAG